MELNSCVYVLKRQYVNGCASVVGVFRNWDSLIAYLKTLHHTWVDELLTQKIKMGREYWVYDDDEGDYYDIDQMILH